MTLNFINELEDSHNKIKYQRALVKIGIDHIRIAVPFNDYSKFVDALSENILPDTKFKSKRLLEVLKQFNGFIEK